jgi:hypothetical protein
MRNRPLLRALVCGVAAIGVLVVPALADELIGRITAVNVDAKKLTVKEKGTDKDVDVTVTDDTVTEKTAKDGTLKTGKVDLEKMKKGVEKSKTGINVEITHQKNVASKIVYKMQPKKKDDSAPKDSPKSSVAN